MTPLGQITQLSPLELKELRIRVSKLEGGRYRCSSSCNHRNTRAHEFPSHTPLYLYGPQDARLATGVGVPVEKDEKENAGEAFIRLVFDDRR
jgi:hypothetical protein